MPILYEKVYEKAQLNEIAVDVLNQCCDFKLFCFKGDLGAGKTALISALCDGLGSADLVNSPTFSIVNEYDCSKGKIFHFDLYRLKTLEEVMDIGFEEYIYSNNYCFIEWPDLVTEMLPKSRLVFCELSYISISERKIKVWIN